jgi:2-amino-4-hydroxy-6-hydroxymethyldihydropteridine diphosphokinase
VEGTVVDEPGLHLPHPGIGQRNFVLVPLADLAPALEIPGLGNVSQRARAAGTDGLSLWDAPIA